MNRLTDIRLHAQQLVAPQFDDPAELIRWMGMVQAQEYGSAKWAVALRLRTPAAAPVEEALREGRILRMHIMRPTWHFIAAEDVRWMLHLSARRIRAANASFAKGNGWTRGTTCVAAGCWNGYSEGATTSRGSRSQGSWNEPEWPSTHRG